MQFQNGNYDNGTYWSTKFGCDNITLDVCEVSAIIDGKYPVFSFVAALAHTSDMTIDWGDGTVEIFTISNSETALYSHAYAENTYLKYHLKISFSSSNFFSLFKLSSFYGNSGIQWLIFRNNSLANANCLTSEVFSKIERVEFDDSCQMIESFYNAFQSSTELMSVKFPGSLPNCTSMEGVLSKCVKLVDISLPTSMPMCSSFKDAFNSCVMLKIPIILPILSSRLVSIENLFAHCHSLLSIDMSNVDGSNVTSLDNVFTECFALKDIALPTNLNSITSAVSTFNSCYSLKSVDLSNYTWDLCTTMKSICMLCKEIETFKSPSSMKRLINIERSFYGCYNLKNFEFSSNAGVSVNQSVYQQSWVQQNVYRVTSIDIPNLTFNNIKIGVEPDARNFEQTTTGLTHFECDWTNSTFAGANSVDNCVNFRKTSMSSNEIERIIEALPTVTNKYITFVDSIGYAGVSAESWAKLSSKGWTHVTVQ